MNCLREPVFSGPRTSVRPCFRRFYLLPAAPSRGPSTRPMNFQRGQKPCSDHGGGQAATLLVVILGPVWFLQPQIWDRIMTQFLIFAIKVSWDPLGLWLVRLRGILCSIGRVGSAWGSNCILITIAVIWSVFILGDEGWEVGNVLSTVAISHMGLLSIWMWLVSYFERKIFWMCF